MNDYVSITPKYKNDSYFHGKHSWPNEISATPDHENRMCFHGKQTWL
ncbi:hypothetical protein MTBBW1_1770005 [Desulfamplus magnetovallimortis]|uniref:Uncharacterized protein n=1 Tax=Desulfamplus magnetovallimortis TaxID=1246637 RepID=A0A1W1HA45_9BACT|nr:hypothetical protein MTBBW1_1770005 [Desulfamplus magnetovallimortis]